MERLVLTFPEVWPTVAGNEFSRELASVIAEIQPDMSGGSGAAAARAPSGAGRAAALSSLGSGTAITPIG